MNRNRRTALVIALTAAGLIAAGSANASYVNFSFFNLGSGTSSSSTTRGVVVFARLNQVGQQTPVRKFFQQTPVRTFFQNLFQADPGANLRTILVEVKPHQREKPKGNGNGTSVVPIPAAAWLFGSGLLGMVGIGYRRRSKTA